MNEPCPAGLIDLAARAADLSGAVIRRHFRSGVAVDDKPDASPVTIADREAEAAIRALLEVEVPGHGIYGEEFGKVRAEAEFVWVLDPVDGTKAFISGMPTFGTLIALMRNGRPILGVIDQPVSGERWIGASGHPTRFNGGPARARSGVPLSRASLFATDPDMFAGPDAARYAALRARIKLRRFGADCYAYGLLASGHVDLVCEAAMQPYDYLALVPVVEGAGGVITDWQGRPLGFDSDGRVLAAGGPDLHAEALAVLAG